MYERLTKCAGELASKDTGVGGNLKNGHIGLINSCYLLPRFKTTRHGAVFGGMAVGVYPK